jgi:hypothetical protein
VRAAAVTRARRLLVAAVAAGACAPAGDALAAETVIDGPARFQVITPTLVRLEYAEDKAFEDRPSLNAIDRDHGPVDVETTVDGEDRVVRTSALELRWRRGSGAFSPQNVSVKLRVGGEERTVRPGWKTPRRFPTPLYQVPEPVPSSEPRTSGNLGGWYRGLDQAMGPVPLHDGLISRDGFHLLDDSRTALLTATSPGYATRPSRTSAYQDGYLFAYGHRYARGLADLRALTGAAPLLPRRAFGNWFSRYANFSEQEYREQILPRFREEGVPLDVLVVDTDFKAPKAWNGWAWRNDLFPDPPGFLRWAHGEGLDVSLNIHPSISADDPKFAEANSRAGGLDVDPTPRCEFFTADPSNQQCSTFDWAKPAHVDAYFDLHAPFERDGTDMWWLDWCCDGSKSSAPGLTGDSWINELYTRRSLARGKRWPVMSRIGSSFDEYGSEGDGVWADHRNAIHFTGDAFDRWEVLDFQTLMTVAEGNIGVPYVSHDIGSFHGGRLPDDMYVRWVQSGAMQPINRLHSSKREGARLPWEYEGKAREVARDFLRLRGRLVPLLYTLAREAHDSGLPMTRGMYLAYPSHDEAYEFDRQYLLGDDVLVAPVASEGDPAVKRVWFPPGEWTDWFTGETHRGPAVKELSVPLERMPLFVRAGGIVPLQEAVERAGNAPPPALELRVQAGADGRFSLYEDEGDGLGYREDRFSRTATTWRGGRTLTIEPARGDFPGRPATRSYEVRVVGVERPDGVTVAGTRVEGWRYEAASRTVSVATGPRSTSEPTVVELLGVEPPRGDGSGRAGGGTAGGSASCLPRRLRVTRRGIGAARLRGTIRPLPPARKRTPRRLHFCVDGGGTVRVVLDRRGRIRLVATTARGHRFGRVRPGARASRRAVARARRGGVLVGKRRGRVRFLAVSTTRRAARQRYDLRAVRLLLRRRR